MEFVTYEQDGFVGVITINRPKALNALNTETIVELNECLKEIEVNAYTRAAPGQSEAPDGDAASSSEPAPPETPHTYRCPECGFEFVVEE